MLRLRFWRLSKGMTQLEAARLLGMSHLTLAYLENGRLQPTARDLDRLRRLFGDGVSRLFEQVEDGLEVGS